MDTLFSICHSAFTDPYRNLALEEYLTASVRVNEIILYLWQNPPAVVIGKNQNTRLECDLSRMTEDGVLPVRRLSGGGAVYHDAGNLCFSFIAGEKHYDVKRNLSLLIAACRQYGIDACASGRNDLLADGKKFSGNAFYTIGGNRCHHGTVLISSDLTRLSRYLTVSPLKLEAKGIPSVRSRVVNLADLCRDVTPEGFSKAMINSVEETFGIPPTPYSLPDLSHYIARAEYLSSPAWIFGEDPEFTDEITVPTDVGILLLRFSVRSGRILSPRIFADTLDPELPRQLENAVEGLPYHRELLCSVLKTAAESASSFRLS